MIIDAILQFFYNIFAWVFDQLPDWTITPDNAALEGLRNFLFPLNAFLPISEMWVVSGIWSAAWVGLMAFKWLNEMIKKMRGSG